MLHFEKERKRKKKESQGKIFFFKETPKSIIEIKSFINKNSSIPIYYLQNETSLIQLLKILEKDKKSSKFFLFDEKINKRKGRQRKKAEENEPSLQTFFKHLQTHDIQNTTQSTEKNQKAKKDLKDDQKTYHNKAKSFFSHFSIISKKTDQYQSQSLSSYQHILQKFDFEFLLKTIKNAYDYWWLTVELPKKIVTPK